MKRWLKIILALMLVGLIGYLTYPAFAEPPSSSKVYFPGLGVLGGFTPDKPGFRLNPSTGDLEWSNTGGTGGSWTKFVDMSGGAPSSAHYLTNQAEAGLSAEVNLGALTTGLLKITVAAGVATPSTASSGSDYAPATSGTAILKGNGSGGFSAATAGTDYTVPVTGTPSTSPGYEGVGISFTNGEASASMNFGDAIYIDGSGNYKLAKSDGTGTLCPAIGMVVSTSAVTHGSAGVYVIAGYLRNDSWTLTTGGLAGSIILTTTGTTGNTWSQSNPASGNYRQEVGYATTSHILFFDGSRILAKVP